MSTYKRSLVIVELAFFKHEPSPPPVLRDKAGATQFIHPALVLGVFELEAGHHQSWIGRLLPTRYRRLGATL